MPIVHIPAPAFLSADKFSHVVAPPALEGGAQPRLSTCEAFANVDGGIRTGTWEATPGRFRRAVVDAEFSHFVAGRATFVSDAGQTYEFRAGDAAFFPRATTGTWEVHETLRKTYMVWRDKTVS